MKLIISLFKLESFDEEEVSCGKSVEEETESEVPVPPDGGWGWVVCLGRYK